MEVIDLHKKLIEDELGQPIIDKELVNRFGGQFVYLYWFDRDGKTLFSAARVVGNEEAILGDAIENKEKAKKITDYFCEIAKELAENGDDII